MKNYDLIIVGGGASGLAAAISSKRKYPEYRIVVLEKLPRIGKKILATGNGRCNLTNKNAVADDYHNGSFCVDAFSKYNPEKVMEFFNSIGLYSYCDSEGRVYPRSNTATSVLDTLRYEIERLGIDVFCDEKVVSVDKTYDGFTVNGSYSCTKIIVTTGGKSSPSQGSDGSGYVLSEKLGHSVTGCYSALVPLVCSAENFKTVKGLRASGVKLSLNGKTTSGEILFTDNGISGIAAMELASEVETLLAEGKKVYLDIDFLPDYSVERLESILNECVSKKLNEEQILIGLLPKMLGLMLVKRIGLRLGDPCFSEELAGMIKCFKVNVSGTRGFENSQVTRGGVPVTEVNSGSLESFICKGLYFAGELLDVDGPCGGYNLQWAFASGLLAGELL